MRIRQDALEIRSCESAQARTIRLRGELTFFMALRVSMIRGACWAIQFQSYAEWSVATMTQSCDCRYSGVNSWLAILRCGIMPHRRQHGNVGIVVVDDRTFVEQQVHELETRRLAGIVDVFLVRHSQESDLAPLDRLAILVEGVGDLADDVARAWPC